MYFIGIFHKHNFIETPFMLSKEKTQGTFPHNENYLTKNNFAFPFQENLSLNSKGLFSKDESICAKVGNEKKNYFSHSKTNLKSRQHLLVERKRNRFSANLFKTYICSCLVYVRVLKNQTCIHSAFHKRQRVHRFVSITYCAESSKEIETRSKVKWLS